MLVRLLYVWSLLFSLALPQPDNRFKPYDWVVYKQPGSIQSISEGYTYTYFASEYGGVWRYHHYRDKFEEPITRAQGLTSDQIQTVFMDMETGILWAATDKSIEYSYLRDGDWRSISLEEYALPMHSKIIQIASSHNYLWAFTGTSYLKLDRTSGISLGMMLSPDEKLIQWSSSVHFYDQFVPEDWQNYSFSDGWILLENQLISPMGNYYPINTTFQSSTNHIWITSDDGWVFLGDKQMEIFYPLNIGPASADITSMTKDDPVMFAGRLGNMSKGITKFYPNRNEFEQIQFENNINSNPQSIYSILDMKDETWFGSDLGILIYIKKQDYWRQLDNTRGIPGVPVTSMSIDSGSVWIGTPRGISKILKRTKRAVPNEIDEVLTGMHIYDIEVVDHLIWIAGEHSLLIYDKIDNILYDFRHFGNTEELGSMINILKQFRRINVQGNHVYIAAQNRLINFNLISKKWSFTIPPESLLWDTKIYSFSVTNEWCFIGTNRGLIRYDRVYNLTDKYQFPFLGSIREIIVRDNQLYLGTNNGLVLFNWTYDL